MHSRFRMNGVLLAALAAMLSSALPGAASAEPAPGAGRRGFRLFARTLGALTVNRVYCGLASDGRICVDSTNSSTIGGGFWPKGTPDQYVFNSGLQIAGVVGPTGGPWAGDTVGGFFFDPKGNTEHGEEVRPISSASDPSDLAKWPAAGCVPNGDASEQVFNPVLRTDATNNGCRRSASQSDVWFMSWEGNPALAAGRKHPLGVVVESRGLGWNFPAGNEDILYFIYTFYNVTSTNPADYAAVRPDMKAILLEQAAKFQSLNEARFGLTLPDGGYTIQQMYAAFAADMDVSDAAANFSTVVLPFALGNTYDHLFSHPSDWRFDPTIFDQPGFFPGVGFVGVKYLKSPTGAGEIQLFSNTINGRPFAGAVNDPRDVVQLYRYLGGTLSVALGDDPCNTGVPSQTRVCFINNNSPRDMRFFQSSTPLTLAPGAFGSIVVAYIFAAPVRTGRCPGATCDLFPGDPTRWNNAAVLVGGANAVDSVAGFAGFTDDNNDGLVQQNEVDVVPGSLLGKSLVAQQIFDNQFLLPFAPEAPEFFLIPGDAQVSVLWRPSTSEATGDPYFDIANAPTISGAVPNRLYDPNYRKFDVEGYRIYRGRVDNPAELVLVAQFDYSGTVIEDYSGLVNPSANCAPELTVVGAPINAGCPTLRPNKKDGTDLKATVVPDSIELVDDPAVGGLVQVKASGGRVVTTDQAGVHTALIVKSDTAALGGGSRGSCGPRSTCPGLTNTGVPFAFVDRDVRNNLRYFYSVVAFDVNSFESAPSILESNRSTRSVTPVHAASNFSEAQLTFGIFGDDGTQLDATKSWAVEAGTGRFRGTPPPTDGLAATFAPLVTALLPAVNLTATVDSLKVHSPLDFPCGAAENGLGACYEAFVTFDNAGVKTSFSTVVYWPVWSGFDIVDTTTAALGAQAITPDPASEARFKVPTGVAKFNAALGVTMNEYIEFSSFEGQAARRSTATTIFRSGAGISAGGSRWFQGADETEPHPGYGIRVGHLPGTDTVWAPIHHTDTDPTTPGAQTYSTSANMQWFGYMAAGLARQADVRFTWGPNGTISAVRDLTHHVNVQFKPTPQASYGFVQDNNGDGVISWDDFSYLNGILQHLAYNGGVGGHSATFFPDSVKSLLQQPAIGPVSVAGAPQFAPPVSGTGFGLYVDGERYIFELTGGQPPAAGTEWTLRTYAGLVRAAAGADGPTPSGYSFLAVRRPPVIPGLRVVFTVPEAATLSRATFGMLRRVHTVPDPYYVTNSFEQSSDNKVIKFVNLPDKAIVRIYSVSGVLVNVLENPGPGCQNVNPAGTPNNVVSGECTWNVRNRNNQVVASGVYFYHVESGSARRVGRFTVVNFAQ